MHWVKWFGISGAIALVAFPSGAQLPFFGGDRPQVAKVEVDVQPEGTEGRYVLTGKTDFPDNTQLRVAALRYLYPANPASQALNPKPTYVVLAYEPAKVENGQWRSTLNLWQVAASGQYQEIWQSKQKELGLAVKPAEEVVFFVTTAPGGHADLVEQVEQQIKQRNQAIDTAMVRYTLEGDRFLQVTRVMKVALPSGGTAPLPERPEDVNGGWGRRYLIPEDPPNPYVLEFPNDRRTNAPPSPEEYMQ